jgi:osomolarity two-component system sensor histidine kinase TcsA
MLQRLGCTFQLLEDGDQVAECLRSSPQPFSVVLMDIVMQRTDGAAVCQELRDNGVLLPIVAMTGNTSQKDVQRFMAAGFDLVLPKPFDIKAMGRALVEGRVRRARHNAQMGLTGGGVGAPAQ